MDETRHRIPWLAGAAAFLLAAALVATHTWWRLDVAGHPQLPHHGLQDFRDATYYPALALRDGVNPYDVPAFLRAYPVGSPFPLYSPVALAVHMPLTLLSYRAAQAVFFGFNLLLVPVLAALALRASGLTASAGRVLALAALILLSRPGQWNAFTGQCTLYMVLAAYAALLWAPTRPSLAGAALALAWLKPTYAGPLSVLLLCRGDRRAVWNGALIAAAVSLPIVLLLMRAAGGIEPLIESLFANQATFTQLKLVDSTTSPYRVDAVALVERLLGASQSAPLSWSVTALMLATAAAAARLSARTDTFVDAPLLICLAIVLSIYHLSYDLLLLVWPATVLAAAVANPATPAPHRTTIAALLALLALPATNYLATESAARTFGLGGGVWQLVTSINAAAVLMVFIACVAVALRAQRTAPSLLRECDTAGRAVEI